MLVKISAAIITFNEERNIARCLSGLQGIADEVVVVDSFSTDRTAEICQQYGVRFITNKFAGYIEQKNFAAAQCTHDIVISLDADEVPDNVMIESIRNVKQNWQGPAYSFNRLTNYCGKWIYHCGWYPDVKARLFDRRECVWGGVNPHDKLQVPGNRVQHLPGNILHYSYYTIDEHRNQTRRFTDIAAAELFKKGVRPTFIKQYLSPVAKFLKDYLLNLGVLDGYYGLMICRISAFATWLKYNKLKRHYSHK